MIKSEKILLEIDVCFIFDDLAFQIYPKLCLFLFSSHLAHFTVKELNIVFDPLAGNCILKWIMK